MKSAKRILTALDGVEPERAMELAERIRKWPDERVSSLSPDQRKAFRKLLLRKNEPKKLRGGQLKWNKAQLQQLLAWDDELRTHGFSYDEAMRTLGALKGIGEKKLAERLTQARKLPRKS